MKHNGYQERYPYEKLAVGGLFQILSTQFVGTPTVTNTYIETIGNTVFTIQSDIDISGSGPAGSETVPLDISVSFN